MSTKCEACGGNGFSGGVVPDEMELDDACEVCLGSGKAAPSDDAVDFATAQPEPYSLTARYCFYCDAEREGPRCSTCGGGTR